MSGYFSSKRRSYTECKRNIIPLLGVNRFHIHPALTPDCAHSATSP